RAESRRSRETFAAPSSRGRESPGGTSGRRRRGWRAVFQSSCPPRPTLRSSRSSAAHSSGCRARKRSPALSSPCSFSSSFYLDGILLEAHALINRVGLRLLVGD